MPVEVREFDLSMRDGTTLHVYDTNGTGRVAKAKDGSAMAVFWQHGTPNTGAPPRPLFPASERLGIRWVSFDRPGYGGSTATPGRDVASAAGCAVAVADALGIGRFGVVGHSGGGCHALACGALAGGRVFGVVSVAALAPFGAEGLDWFAGMGASTAGSLRAALRGRAAKEAYEAEAEFDPAMFTPADHAALETEWAWFDEVVRPAGGAIDEDLAYVGPWGFDPADVKVPMLVLHGEKIGSCRFRMGNGWRGGARGLG